MPTNGSNIVQAIERWAPKAIAMEGDAIGLQVGTLHKPVQRVMVTLDTMLDSVIDEAIDKRIDLIISHHAAIYKPLKHLRTDTPFGRMYEKLIKNDIAVYVSHTNFDAAPGGMNDLLAEAIGLQDIKILQETGEASLKKLVVYVPHDHVDAVHAAMSKAGAGWIGKYSHCSFQTPGTGTFLPEEGTNPHIGQAGKLERVHEMRIETVVPESKLGKVIGVMKKAHPYEEVAYDVYSLEISGEAYGVGRYGKLPQETTLDEFAQHVKKVFGVQGVRVVGDGQQRVRKVGVWGGSGGDFIGAAKFRGVDAFITGDIGYHDGHEAQTFGMGLIDPGHNIEKIMKPAVAQYLRNEAQKQGWDVEVFASEANTDPFRFV